MLDSDSFFHIQASSALKNLCIANYSDSGSCSCSNSSLLGEEEPTRVPSVPFEGGGVEPSIATQVPESEEQRNSFQKVMSLIRRQNGLKVPKPEVLLWRSFGPSPPFLRQPSSRCPRWFLGCC